MKLESRYDIGHTVFAPEVEEKSRPVQCTDCLGTEVWHVTLENGEKFDIKCPNCTTLSGPPKETHFVGRVITLTIGSVQFDTEECDYRENVRYMCRETGVGSGRVWGGSMLHPSRELAEEKLPGMIAEQEARLAERLAHNFSAKRERAGDVEAMYRAEIRRAKRAAKKAAECLARYTRRRELEDDSHS
jgi:hypothetical protein